MHNLKLRFFIQTMYTIHDVTMKQKQIRDLDQVRT